MTSGCHIDFSLYTKAMIDEEKQKESGGSGNTRSSKKSECIKQLFSKKPLLQISKLRMTHHSKHCKPNKLSDKMGRRDIQFYDLYKLDKPSDAVEKLEDKSYAREGVLKGLYKDEAKNEIINMDDQDEPIYGDIEIDDFNKLFRNPNVIRDQFGESISVKL